MAADLTSTEVVPSVPVPVPAAADEPPPAAAPTGTPYVAGPHRTRFLVVYSLLAVVLALAVAGVVVFASRSISPPTAWSAWKPSGGGLGAAKQIADHVGTTYRLPNGSQMVDVIAKEPSVSPGNQTIPVHYVAVRGTGGRQDQVIPVSSSDSVMYSLCGLGAACSIASGKPSVARGTLVRREILELALYTFKYVGGVKNVIAFMPPAAGSNPQYVVYLQKTDVAQQLRVPLLQTLGSKVPLPSTIPAREVHTVDVVTKSKLYSFSLSQTQAGDAVLVFAPLPA
ncbi:MAG: hypothetical protein ACYDCH_11260 [Gaiellaceae bacterium]